MPVQLGGTEGDPTRGDRGTETWPRLEAEYLKKRLSRAYRPWDKYNSQGDPFMKGAGPTDARGAGGQGLAPGSAAEHVYLENVVKNYKQEADEELKHEFNLWLEGKHIANNGQNLYTNGEGKARRVYTSRNDEWTGLPGNPAAPVPRNGLQIGDTKHNWRHTPWGKKQLTHLPGVREYLREQGDKAAKAEEYLNLLAEFGPQDLEQAWIYFKHWVKGKPASEVILPGTAIGNPDTGVTPQTIARNSGTGDPRFLEVDHYDDGEMGVRSAAFDLQPSGAEEQDQRGVLWPGGARAKPYAIPSGPSFAVQPDAGTASNWAYPTTNNDVPISENNGPQTRWNEGGRRRDGRLPFYASGGVAGRQGHWYDDRLNYGVAAPPDLMDFEDDAFDEAVRGPAVPEAPPVGGPAVPEEPLVGGPAVPEELPVGGPAVPEEFEEAEELMDATDERIDATDEPNTPPTRPRPDPETPATVQRRPSEGNILNVDTLVENVTRFERATIGIDRSDNSILKGLQEHQNRRVPGLYPPMTFREVTLNEANFRQFHNWLWNSLQAQEDEFQEAQAAVNLGYRTNNPSRRNVVAAMGQAARQMSAVRSALRNFVGSPGWPNRSARFYLMSIRQFQRDAGFRRDRRDIPPYVPFEG